MKNFLIDQNSKHLANDEYKHHFENYDKMFIVGKDLKQREYDEGLAKFCKKNKCDLITTDGTAYIHFFAEKIKAVKISQLFYDDKADRPVLIVKIID